MTISVEIINQLNDNYSYLISSNKNNLGIIIDPAESNKILDVLKKKKLNLNYIFITHHHSDHISGVAGLIKAYPEVKIFSPSKLNSIPVNLISDGNTITTNLNEFEVIHAPGHTLDHIILCDQKNNLIFVGDVLFRLGCGRVFEGTLEQMHNSLTKLLNLSDKMLVYCGHEYTLNNIKFLEHIFKKNKILESAKKNIISDLSLNKRSIPFHLGDEKKYNPFLNQNCEMVLELRSENNYSDFEFFRYLREEKDSF